MRIMRVGPAGAERPVAVARDGSLLDLSEVVGDGDIDHLVWYLSQFMVLEPGDIVDTGTPAGVAQGRSDTPFLRPGDSVQLEIEGLGRQRQILVQA